MKKILHTIYTGFSAVVVMALTLASCIDDELVKNNNVVEGVPITVTMNLSGKAAADVTVETKATGTNFSALSDLVICVFHGDGSFEQIVTNYGDNSSLTVDSYASSETDDDGNRRYTVSFKSTSGTKKLIAVANVADGGYWEGLTTLLEDVYTNKKSFDEVKTLIAGLNEDILTQADSENGVPPFSIASSSQMFMSGWNEDVIFGTNNSITSYGTYGVSADKVAIQMYRSMAHITFNIVADPEGAQGTFTPTSYRVYNIPTKSYLMNDKQGVNAFALTSAIPGMDAKTGYIHTASSNIGTAQGGSYSFNFYMPENVQNLGTNDTAGQDFKVLYQQRDMWNSEGNAGAAPENKDWTYAPDQSTFVLISGTYESKSTTTDEDYIGNVEYTIHLGDFSTATGSLNNFSVERNVSYTYNVQVLGVKNIVVEATTDNGEKQPSAEGSIYDRTDTEYAYNLDAHYEQVFLEYNLSNIVAELQKQNLSDDELDEAIANQLVLVIQSEAMDHNANGVVNKRGSLRPYKIYADAIAQGEDAAEAKANILNGDMDGSATPTKGFDYKWVEFWPQTGTTIADYPGMSSWAMDDLNAVYSGESKMVNQNFYAGATGTGDATNLKDVYDVIVAMGKAVKSIYNSKPITTGSMNDDGIIITNTGTLYSPKYVARFTAFVNEYYYLRHPLTGAKATSWSVMTNKIPREMIIAMSTQTSPDGNNSYSKIHSYISQLSMQTFYNDRVKSLNAFGIETYNETPLSYEFGNPVSTSGLSDTDGRENQKILIGASSTPLWISYIKTSGNGWTSSVGTDHTKHKLTGAYNIEKEKAYSACMSRNRDLNGNGRIDENEIRWFLPSINEYIRIGIGVSAISSAAKLYIGDKSAMENTSANQYPIEYISDGALYFTSSPADKRVFWAVEKGAYSYDGRDYVNGYNGKPIRCIRVLPATSGNFDISSINGVKSDPTYVKHDATANRPTILEFKDRLVSSLYRQRVVDFLAIHNEDDVANYFYDGIYVAEDYLKKGNNDAYYAFSALLNITSKDQNPCQYYTEHGISGWRLPNLVELSAMNAAGDLINDCAADDTYSPDKNVASCTKFSNQSVRLGFVRTNGIGCYTGSKEIRVRCVRDVPDGFVFPTD